MHILLTLALALSSPQPFVTTSLGKTVQLKNAVPNAARLAPAEYPEAARLARVFGPVKLEVLIDRDGKVAGVTVTEGRWAPLNGAAINMARATRFEPVVIDGERVPAQFGLVVDFRPH